MLTATRHHGTAASGGRGAVNSRCGPAHRLNPVCSQPHLLRTSLVSLTMDDASRLGRRRDLNRSRKGWMNRGRQNGAFITVAGPRHASRLRAERRRVHRAGSRGPQHRPVSRETRSATDDASHVAARHEGRHLPSCEPASTHRPSTRPAHSLEPRLPMKGPVRVSVGGTLHNQHRTSIASNPRTDGRQGMQTDSRSRIGPQ